MSQQELDLAQKRRLAPARLLCATPSLVYPAAHSMARRSSGSRAAAGDWAGIEQLAREAASLSRSYEKNA